MRRIFHFVLFLLFVQFCDGQDHRAIGFSTPIHLPFHLAGSFGEPRPDHFHSGIDIKTNGVEGEPVFSIYDGYISRIRVSPYGYGRSLYITHPNGYTSVYGHLSRFNAELEKYVHEQHYKREQSELDIFLDTNAFPVKQNDTIAFSGNTGGSTAPHLHFEIRDSKTEHALQPLDFYPKEYYEDKIPPQLNQVKIYQFDSLFYGAVQTIMPLQKVSSGLTTKSRIPLNFPNFCFSLEGFDKQDSSENKNGIQKIEVLQQDVIVFSYDIRDIDFDKTRMCNAFVDQEELSSDSGYFYHCFRLKNNTLNIYPLASNGFFHDQQDSFDIKILCYDYNDNQTMIRLPFIRNKQTDIPTTKPKPVGHLNTGARDSITLKNFVIRFPANTFYDNVNLGKLALQNDKGPLPDVYWIYGRTVVPLQKPAELEIIPPTQRSIDKMVVMLSNFNGKENALNTTHSSTTLFVKTRDIGRFSIKYDTVAPLVSLLNFTKKDASFSDHVIRVQIKDELSGISDYKGYIDGRWVNFYYDAKNDVIEYHFDEFCPGGKHMLKIVVSDKKENQTILNQKFYNPKNP